MTLQLNTPGRLLRGMVFLMALVPALLSAQVTNPIKLMRGTVISAKSGKPIDGGKIWAYEADHPNKKSVNNSKINAGTGFYQMILDPQVMYRFHVKTDGHYISDFYICTPGGLDYEETDTNLVLEPIPIGATLFKGRLFEPNKSELIINSQFKSAVDVLKINPAIVVAITLTPDTKLDPPPPPAPVKKKPEKKGKKGAPEAAPAPPPPAPVTLTEEQKKELGKQRLTAIKEYMKTQEVSVTRLEWTFADPVELPYTALASSYPSNVDVRIKSISKDEEDSDTDSDN